MVGVVLLFELVCYFNYCYEKLSLKVYLVYFKSLFYYKIFPELEIDVNGNSFFSPLPPLPFSFSAIVISFFKLTDLLTLIFYLLEIILLFCVQYSAAFKFIICGVISRLLLDGFYFIWYYWVDYFKSFTSFPFHWQYVSYPLYYLIPRLSFSISILLRLLLSKLKSFLAARYLGFLVLSFALLF